MKTAQPINIFTMILLGLYISVASHNVFADAKNTQKCESSIDALSLLLACSGKIEGCNMVNILNDRTHCKNTTESRQVITKNDNQEGRVAEKETSNTLYRVTIYCSAYAETLLNVSKRTKSSDQSVTPMAMTIARNTKHALDTKIFGEYDSYEAKKLKVQWLEFAREDLHSNMNRFIEAINDCYKKYS